MAGAAAGGGGGGHHHDLFGEDTGQIGGPSNIKTVAGASFIGTAIEWYDFFLYGTAAATVFGPLFFPNVEDPLIATLFAFGTYSVGFIARPFGGVVFGHFGDKIGRKSMLVLSLLIMGVATVFIGLLPTYATIGVFAPILLVVIRFLQGIGIGGEWGGAVLMAVEHAPPGKRGFYGSWPQMGVPAGLFLGNGVFLIVSNSMSEESFLAWGWRLPFLLSALLVVVGLVIRLKLEESPTFKAVKETHTEAEMPIIDVLKTHPGNVLRAMGMRIAENGVFYISITFSVTYALSIDIERNTMLTGIMVAALIGLLTTPLWGGLSDKVGRKPVYLAGAVFSLLYAFVFFDLIDTKSPVLIWIAIILAINIGHDLMYGPQAAYFSELFGTRVRYSGASLGYQLASVIAGGISPLIAVALLARTPGDPGGVVLLMAFMSLITVIAVVVSPETYKDDIGAVKEQERSLIKEPGPAVG
jgi:MFS transporter, MHS family, shikimate and dehydroshikimate transport protein